MISLTGGRFPGIRILAESSKTQRQQRRAGEGGPFAGDLNSADSQLPPAAALLPGDLQLEQSPLPRSSPFSPCWSCS